MSKNSIQALEHLTMDGDPSFGPDHEGLERALILLQRHSEASASLELLPTSLPEQGTGDSQALESLAPRVLGEAARLDGDFMLAHMDPPTPWMTWATTLWNASLNQNLLHPATSPVARDLEATFISWLAPFFGMDGGHMTPGSTVANITALWVARDLRHVEEVVASDMAHVSIEKAARLLRIPFRKLKTDPLGHLLTSDLGDLRRSCLVLTAGHTSTGVIDPLDLAGRAAWTHVDAAWAGPLRLSRTYGLRLDGIEQADSIAISGHKLLFQPKESGIVLFRDTDAANQAISFGGAYLNAPNVGLLGSRGANAVPLLATLLAWGRTGLETRLDRCMRTAEQVAKWITDQPRLQLLQPPGTGVFVWRPIEMDVLALVKALPPGLASTTQIAGEPWLRCVSANPNANPKVIIAAIADRIAHQTTP
jgi:L-2,4-diaminobutyrate decarboxylase